MRFGLATLLSSLSQMQPHNSRLGETLSARFSDGSELFLEHTGNEKGVLFLLEGPCYRVHGRIVINAGVNESNLVLTLSRSKYTIEFLNPDDGSKI